MSNVLVIETTGPGVQALEYARVQGHSVILVSSRTYDFFVPPAQRERARSLASVCLEVDDPREETELLDALKSADVTPGQIDVVFSPFHMGALPAARLAREFGVRGTSPESLAAALDKARCRQLVREQGLPDVRFAVASSAAEAISAADGIGYPVIVKPARGVAKVVTRIARSARDIEAHFAAADEQMAALAAGVATELDRRFMIEEIAVGDLVSVEIAADGHAVTPLAVVRRKTGRDNPVLELGNTVPTRMGAGAERALGEYATEVCRALGLDFGVFHVELILTADGPRLVEVNPRIAGGGIPDTIQAATGQSLFETLVDLHLGVPVPRKPWPAIAGASHSLIGAAEECAVRADLPPDWFDAVRPRIHSGSASIQPGARLCGMEGNFDVYGLIRVIGATAADAEGECDGLLAEIARTLGVRFPSVAPMMADIRD